MFFKCDNFFLSQTFLALVAFGAAVPYGHGYGGYAGYGAIEVAPKTYSREVVSAPYPVPVSACHVFVVITQLIVSHVTSHRW